MVRVVESALGGFEAVINQRVDGADRKLYMFEDDTRFGAVRKIESCILENFQDWDILLNLNAPWRKKAAGQPCTDGQYNYMVRLKITRGRRKDQISKAQAMHEISMFLNRR